MMILLKEINPEGNLIPPNIYEIRKLVSKLNFKQKKIDFASMVIYCITKVIKMKEAINFVVHFNTRNVKREREYIKMWLSRDCTSCHSYQGFNDYMLL